MNDMSAILDGGQIQIDGSPLIGDDHDAAPRGEFARNAPAVQGRRARLPGDAFDGLALAQALQQAETSRIAVQSIDIVEDERQVAVLKGRLIDAEGTRSAMDPAPVIAKLLHRSTFSGARAANDDQQLQV